jgi:hypothetical protein
MLVPMTRASSNGLTPAGERVGGERRAQVVNPSRPANPGGLDRRRPLAAAEVTQVEQPARGRREQEPGVQARRQSVERGDAGRGQRHLAARARCLGEIDDLPAGHRAAHRKHAVRAVDVAAVERLPLLGAEPGRAANAGRGR